MSKRTNQEKLEAFNERMKIRDAEARVRVEREVRRMVETFERDGCPCCDTPPSKPLDDEELKFSREEKNAHLTSLNAEAALNEKDSDYQGNLGFDTN